MTVNKAITLPNSLTFLRILLTPVFLILLFSESSFWKQISLVVYIVAALTDWYDGWTARRFGYVSRWGQFFDPLADKVLAAAALFAFVYLDLVDAWMVWLIVVRDFLITGLRTLAEYRGQPIVTSRTAQAKTFGQFVVIYYILILYVARSIPFVRHDYGEIIDALLDHQVLFGMMLVVTLSNVGTGLLYLFDNRKFLEDLPAVKSLSTLFATGFYSGYSPLVPGTAGSLVGAILFATPLFTEITPFLIIILTTFFVGVWTSGQLERRLGEDPQIVVIDEIVGMWVSLLFIPRGLWPVAVAFVLFRVFDTFKPFPARRAEELKHGWGIMLDDVVAGVYANIGTQIIIRALHFAP
jgi:CDP-diacylglycerol--glycerol-3-phosphate 3-phosphatidyltransferase